MTLLPKCNDIIVINWFKYIHYIELTSLKIDAIIKKPWSLDSKYHLFFIFSRPGQSQGLLDKHLCISFSHSVMVCENINTTPPQPSIPCIVTIALPTHGVCDKF